MKPIARTLPRIQVRLRPGGHLFLRPPLLRQLNWNPTDVWCLEFEQGRLRLFRQPSERERRIARLRARTRPPKNWQSISKLSSNGEHLIATEAVK